MPRKSQSRRPYIAHAAERIWPQVRRRASRSGVAGRHVVRVRMKTISTASAASASSAGSGLSMLRRTNVRAPRDRAAEEVGRAGADRAAAGHRDELARQSVATT